MIGRKQTTSLRRGTYTRRHSNVLRRQRRSGGLGTVPWHFAATVACLAAAARPIQERRVGVKHAPSGPGRNARSAVPPPADPVRSAGRKRPGGRGRCRCAASGPSAGGAGPPPVSRPQCRAGRLAGRHGDAAASPRAHRAVRRRPSRHHHRRSAHRRQRARRAAMAVQLFLSNRAGPAIMRCPGAYECQAGP
jgi:hypothetical protein